MAHIQINVGMDSDVNEQAQRIFSDLGIDTDTAINIFFRQVIRTNGLPFMLKADTPNAETIEALREVEAMKKDPSLGKSYTDVDTMMKEILS